MKRDESRKGMRLLMAKDAKVREDDQFLIDSGASSLLEHNSGVST
jgi:hypothetical protein